MFLEELESRLQHVIFQWLEDWRPIENEKRALAEIPSFHFHHLSKILGGDGLFFIFSIPNTLKKPRNEINA